MKIAIVSDAWHPQINGVVMTLVNTQRELQRLGHDVKVFGPERFKTIPCPSYPEIKLSLFPRARLSKLLAEFSPDAVHIATEGPLGLAARGWCRTQQFPFTTSFHTRFPDYVRLRTGIPVAATYRLMRWFHAPARAVMVATPALADELAARGFQNLALWSRGVDTDIFHPRPKDFLKDQRPIFTFVGRVAVEKNIETYLQMNLPGTKYVIGGGPDLPRLKQKYPAVRFIGYKMGEDLARHVAAADVFVFPSRTDTFGLVVIEALACGVPVAAYPVQGPADIIENGVSGFVSDDLRGAAIAALKLDPDRCRARALQYTWAQCTQQFLTNIANGRSAVRAA